MAGYTIAEKDSFTVIGLGVDLKSDYTDYAGIYKEKADFWQAVSEDGRLDLLKGIAANDYVFVVNEAVNGKMMHYAGVMAGASVQVPQEARVIQFPKGEYLVVAGEGATTEELSNTLTGLAFGQALPQAEGYAYVGGPNAAVEMGSRDGSLYGEMWIPVVRN